MSARWASFGVWALVAASALYWGLKLFVASPAAPARTQLAQPGVGLHGDLTRLLGADVAAVAAAAAPEPAPDARFKLVGVVSPRSRQAAREGLALIAVDGKPARAYRVGTLVDGQNVLQSVGARSATLGPRGGESVIALNIDAPPAAATATLANPPPGVVTRHPGLGRAAFAGSLPPPAYPKPAEPQQLPVDAGAAAPPAQDGQDPRQ
jgi:general secretion pathway protein C